jgi:hypothetical protein
MIYVKQKIKNNYSSKTLHFLKLKILRIIQFNNL